MAKKKSECNIVAGIAAWILISVGLWALATGFITHLTTGTAITSAALQTVMPWYIGGVLLIGIGKMIKCKACGCTCK